MPLLSVDEGQSPLLAGGKGDNDFMCFTYEEESHLETLRDSLVASRNRK